MDHMSKQGLANAIGLATVDKTFRNRLLADPAGAIAGTGIDLDNNEIAFLKEGGTQAMIRDYGDYLSIDYGGGKNR